jgi:hypothetical protein
MGHRNRYLEGRDNGQMTPRGYPSFNSYVENLRFLYSGQMDRGTDIGTDRGMETLIWCGLGNLICSSKLIVESICLLTNKHSMWSLCLSNN